MLNISGATTENVRQVLKYLHLESGVELPKPDSSCVRMEIRRYFLTLLSFSVSSLRLFLCPNYLRNLNLRKITILLILLSI